MKTRKCYGGFPKGYVCDKAAMPMRHWCPECEEKRIAHIDRQFADLYKPIETESVPEKPKDKDSK